MPNNTDSPKVSAVVESAPVAEVAKVPEVATTTTTETVVTQTVSSAPVKKSHGLLIGILVFLGVIIIAVVIGTVIASKSQTNIPVFSDIASFVERIFETPQQRAQKAGQALLGKLFASQEIEQIAPSFAQSAEYQSMKRNLSVPTTVSNPAPTSSKMEIEINFDMNQTSTEYTTGRRSQTEANVRMLISGYVGEKDADLDVELTGESQGIQLTLSAKMIVKNGNFYAKFISIPALLGTEFKSLENQWIKLSKEDIAEIVTGYSEALNSSMENMTASQKAANDQSFQRLLSIVNSNAVINSIQAMNDEVLDNVRNTCVAFEPNKASLIEILDDVSQTSTSTSTANPVNSEVIANMIKKLRFESCSGKIDQLPYRMRMQYTVEDEGTAGNSVNLDIKIRAWDYNVAEVVNAPTGTTIDMMELLTPIIQRAMFGTSSTTYPSTTYPTNTLDTPDTSTFNEQDYLDLLEEYNVD